MRKGGREDECGSVTNGKLRLSGFVAVSSLASYLQKTGPAVYENLPPPPVHTSVDFLVLRRSSVQPN